MTRTRRSSEEVRAAIMERATAEFSTTGYPQTTMRAVAERAGVSLSVLYRHFESKEDLFAAAVITPFTAFLKQFAAAWRDQIDAPLDERGMVEEFVRDFHGALAPHRDAIVALVALHEAPNMALLERLRASLTAVVSDIGRIAQHEARRRDRRPDLSLQRVWLVISLLIGELLMRPLLPDVWGGTGGTGSRTGQDPMTEAITALLVHGLRLEGP
jgi:AcrR family transcriptional regulator